MAATLLETGNLVVRKFDSNKGGWDKFCGKNGWRVSSMLSDSVIVNPIINCTYLKSYKAQAPLSLCRSYLSPALISTVKDT